MLSSQTKATHIRQNRPFDEYGPHVSFRSAEILPLQIAHHLHIAGLAALLAPGQQILVARSQVLLADARVAGMPVRAGVDARHDARRDIIVFPDQRFAVRLLPQIPVAEGAEGRQLLAVVRLAELLADRGRDEAQAEELLAEAGGNGVVIAQIERRLRIPLHPLFLHERRKFLADRQLLLAQHRDKEDGENDLLILHITLALPAALQLVQERLRRLR